jgi:WD40 repeat protein/tetratricopeptide (TPR) repeat protein
MAVAPMKQTRRIWRPVFVAAIILMTGGIARAVEDATTLLDEALDYFAGYEARKAVAVLSDAARKYPQDHKIAGLLYKLLRDQRWAVGQTLPVKLPAGITVVRFSPDGNLLIAGAEDGTVRILDTDTGKLLDGQVKHPGAVVGVVILPGNELACSIGKTGDAILWKIADGSTVKSWSNKDSSLTAGAISKDFRRLALGYANGEVRVYDRDQENQLGESVKYTKAITSLGFSPDGETLGMGSADGTARVFDVVTQKPHPFVVKHKSALVSVEVGRHDVLLTASEDGIARTLNAKDGKLIAEINTGAKIRNAHLGGSATYLSTILDDSTVRIWEVQTGKAAPGVIRTDDGIVDADWGPAGLSLVTASDGPVAYNWRVRDGRRVTEGMLHQSPVHVAAYGPNSRRIATGCKDGTLRVWRVDVGAASEGLPTIRTHNAAVRSASFSADGQGIVSCARDLTTIRWKRAIVHMDGHAIPFEAEPVCAAYSPDRSLIVTVTEDGKALLSAGKSGEARGTRDLGAPARWVDFNKDGKRFVTTAGSKAVIWSVDDDKPIGAPIEHPKQGDNELHMARFSPDGNLIVTASNDGTARVWDVSSRKELAVLKIHEGPVTTARFSFDGKMLVTAGADGTIVVWDTAKWQQTGATMMLPGAIYSALIGPNDEYVAATSEQSAGIRGFEISSGRLFGSGIDTPSEATTIDLDPTGQSVVVACADGTVRTYESPWVREELPKWFPEFAEQIVEMRVDGPDKFAPVPSTLNKLKQYPPADADPKSEFSILAKWLTTQGIDRTTSPRTKATIEASVTQRVDERSLDALYELFEAQPANPLIFAAMSLFVPGQRQGEYLAEYALARADKAPLAKAYVASTFAKYNRIEEAERIMKEALDAAPNDPRILRRAAKLDIRAKRKDEALAKLDRAVAADPDDEVTYRDYGWQMYDLKDYAKAMEQFKKADEWYGGRDTDVNSGIALTELELGHQDAAVARYKRLIKIGSEWGDAEYIRSLKGWTEKELIDMERLRGLATKTVTQK